MLKKSTIEIPQEKISAATLITNTAGLVWDVLKLAFPRLRQTQVTLARFVKLEGAWESKPRRTPLPMTRRWQYVRIDALDGREKYGWHPEGEALCRLHVEGVTTDGAVVPLHCCSSTNARVEFSLRTNTPLVAIRIQSNLGIPVRVRWICDDLRFK